MLLSRRWSRSCSLALPWAVLAAATLVAQPAPPRATLADLAWFEGHWLDESADHLSEEIWTAPSGDSLLGMWRYVSQGRLRISEILSITDEPEGIALRLRHFDPRLTAREEQDAPVVLRLVAWKAREAVFERAAVGGQGRLRLSYRRPSDDSLVAVLENDGKAEEYRYRLRDALR